MNARTLASSRHYRVEHEYESASLVAGDGRKRAIGEFYGDPAVALIDAGEQWCAVAGEGLIVCSLAPVAPAWNTTERRVKPSGLPACGKRDRLRWRPPAKMARYG